MTVRARRRRPHLWLALTLGMAAALAAPNASAVRNPMVQNLMKRLNAAASAGDTGASAEILRVVKMMGPDEYADWEPIAEKARAAAAAGELGAMKRACTDCHDKYRARFRCTYGSEAPGERLPSID